MDCKLLKLLPLHPLQSLLIETTRESWLEGLIRARIGEYTLTDKVDLSRIAINPRFNVFLLAGLPGIGKSIFNEALLLLFNKKNGRMSKEELWDGLEGLLSDEKIELLFTALTSWRSPESPYGQTNLSARGEKLLEAHLKSVRIPQGLDQRHILSLFEESTVSGLHRRHSL